MVSGLSLAQSALNEMNGLDVDWEAIESEPPNATSKDVALRILDRSFLIDRVRPSYTTASAEGGVGIVYRSQDKYAAIECLNSGAVWLLWYDQQGNPCSREIEDNTVAIETARSGFGTSRRCLIAQKGNRNGREATRPDLSLCNRDSSSQRRSAMQIYSIPNCPSLAVYTVP